VAPLLDSTPAFIAVDFHGTAPHLPFRGKMTGDDGVMPERFAPFSLPLRSTRPSLLIRSAAFRCCRLAGVRAANSARLKQFRRAARSGPSPTCSLLATAATSCWLPLVAPLSLSRVVQLLLHKPHAAPVQRQRWRRAARCHASRRRFRHLEHAHQRRRVTGEFDLSRCVCFDCLVFLS
jgi:hypothetical protein